MPKYQVSMPKVIWLTIDVEADNEEQAQEKAWDEAPGSICAQCTGWGSEGWSIDDDNAWGDVPGIEIEVRLLDEEE
jgi:hypothetical protein